MAFPAKVDEEDMALMIKEWVLVGYRVFTDKRAIGIFEPSAQGDTAWLVMIYTRRLSWYVDCHNQETAWCGRLEDLALLYEELFDDVPRHSA